jgi:hypothetical protein
LQQTTQVLYQNGITTGCQTNEAIIAIHQYRPSAKTIKRFDLTRRRLVPGRVRRDIYKIKKSTTLQNTINLLKWDRKASGSFDAELRATTIITQNSMRIKYQLAPTRDKPWDTYTFRQWKHFVTNLCLSAVQDALRNENNSKTGMQHLFAPDRSDKAAVGNHSTKSNVQGMLLYHPILLESPWQAPDDLNKQIICQVIRNKRANACG